MHAHIDSTPHVELQSQSFIDGSNAIQLRPFWDLGSYRYTQHPCESFLSGAAALVSSIKRKALQNIELNQELSELTKTYVQMFKF